MEYTTVTVQVPKATYALEQAVKNFVLAAVKATADGWQPLTDVPSLVTEALRDFVPVLATLGDVAAEMKADPAAELRVAGLTVAEMVNAYVKKGV